MLHDKYDNHLLLSHFDSTSVVFCPYSYTYTLIQCVCMCVWQQQVMDTDTRGL